MLRRILVVTLFLVSGFLAGLVLTGRMRTAEESSAAQAPPPLRHRRLAQPLCRRGCPT